MAGPPSTAPITAHPALGKLDPHVVASGPAIPPIERVALFSEEQWEHFTDEWAASLTDYAQVERASGAGDKGCDIVAFPVEGGAVWDNYQCKHYDKPLTPTDIWVELGKIYHYSFIGGYTVPRKYRFVAPRNVGTKLASYLRKPATLKAELLKIWDDKCKDDIKSVPVPLTEIPDRQQRIEAIAKDYVARPENTLIVSPHNASRRDINDAVRAELQNSGALSKENHPMTVLTQRSELTSADRNWAALYQPADVLCYTRGSKELEIDRGTYATVVSTNPKDNQLTVERQDGQHVTYNPERLHGIAAYREIFRDFSEEDRIQFTASKPDMNVKNRDLGTVERIEGTSMSVRMDGEKNRTLTFDSSQMRHFDHGYAVTSHSSQGLTADRVLVNMDTTAHPELVNTRFAYVSVSRASQDARIYTNDVSTLAERFSTDISKTSAVQLETPHGEHHQQPRPSPQPKEHTMTNSNEQTPRRAKAAGK